MTELSYDAVVIGGGAAGMAAALELDARGLSSAIVDREGELGGVLPQCIHNGFGLQEFDEELTGPEFAQRFSERVSRSGVGVFSSTTVRGLEPEAEGYLLSCASSIHGMMRLRARAVILAMGCRERNRGNLRIPGSRPAGVFTAGLAQRLVNMDGYLPGKRAVIIGSGDIGLIMARRLSWSGSHVEAVVEILDRPSGLPRNIAQCLEDFNIPLLLSHATTAILGRDRVEAVQVAPLENGAPDMERSRLIPCDCVLLSVGLVPENELSRQAGVEINPMTGGALVDARLMTSLPGVFACGNVLHVHDLVDYAAEEARRAGAFAARWLAGERPAAQYRVRAGANLRYLAPSSVEAGSDTKLYMRPLVNRERAALVLRAGERELERQGRVRVKPQEMLSLTIKASTLEAAMLGLSAGADPGFELSLE